MSLSLIKKPLFAAIVGAFAAVSAQASVVVVTPASPIAIANTLDGVYINLVTGASGATGSATTGWDINPYFASAGLNFFSNGTTSGYVAVGGVATALTPGSTISSASTFATGVVTGTAFRVTGQEYVGFRFTNESTGATNYGYALISTTAPLGNPASVVSWAYENTGAAITIPAVPEPATYAMFGAGLLGVLALRRRRSV